MHDGYVLTKSISRSPVGGKLLNSCLHKALEARGIAVKPRQTFKRVEKKPGEFVVSVLGAAGAGGAGTMGAGQGALGGMLPCALAVIEQDLPWCVCVWGWGGGSVLGT